MVECKNKICNLKCCSIGSYRAPEHEYSVTLDGSVQVGIFQRDTGTDGFLTIFKVLLASALY